ncbi:MAG: EMC3/TMCO1 family protein [Candidatus Geothermarchaeales archaeon]
MADIYNPSIALLIIFGVSSLVSLSYMVINKKFIYTPDYARKKRTVDEWNKRYKEAQKSKDSKLIKKLEKRQDQIRKMQSELAMKTFKLFIFTTAPFWLVYYLLFQTYSSLGQFVVLPIPLPLMVWPPVGTTNFFWWYVISSFTFSNLLRKAFKVG